MIHDYNQTNPAGAHRREELRQRAADKAERDVRSERPGSKAVAADVRDQIRSAMLERAARLHRQAEGLERRERAL